MKHFGEFTPVTAELNGFGWLYQQTVMTIHIYMYAFARCLYPMLLTLHSTETIVSVHLFPGNQTNALGAASSMLFEC